MKVNVTVKTVNKESKKIIAKCSHTGEFEASFESMEALRKAWPSAEITCVEEHDGYTVVYC